MKYLKTLAILAFFIVVVMISCVGSASNETQETSDKADLVVFGMGERPILEVTRRLAAGETVRDLRDMRGVAYAMGAKESPPSGD